MKRMCILPLALLCTFFLSAATAAQAEYFWAGGIPQPAFERVQQLMNDGHYVKKVAFAPGGGWLVLYDTNGYAGHGVPQNLSDKLNEMNLNGSTIKSVAFGPNRGWVVLYDNRGIAYYNVPQVMEADIPGMLNAANDLVDVTIPTTYSYAVVGKGGAAWHRNLETPIANAVNDINSHRLDFRGIAISPAQPKEWVVLYSEKSVAWNHPTDLFNAKIPEILNGGNEIASFSFANNGQGIMFWK